MEPIVIARAPGHISLGFADSPDLAPGEDLGEALISVAVNHHAYAIVTPSRDKDIRIACAEHNAAPDDDPMWGAELALPKAIARFLGVREGLSVLLCAQAPLRSGLGLSGSLTVSMVKALAFSCGLDLEAGEVAELAVSAMADTLGLASDGQHLHAAAYGGLNVINRARDQVQVEPLRLSAEVRQSLEAQLMLFEADCPTCLHSSKSYRSCTEMRDPAPAPSIQARRETCQSARLALEQGDLTAFADSLHWLWPERHRAAEASNDPFAVECYQIARDNGAIGGQLIGARQRGFLLLCPEAHQQRVTDSLTALGLQRWPLALEEQGVQVMEAVSRAGEISLPPIMQTLQRGIHLPQTQ
ncbi:MAG: hypothetical protein GX601_03480 [Anaerolineales bacterium]|nr:hypothetical protein [Anaerolineales bacterium]